jgi:serine/threonine-protein kinase
MTIGITVVVGLALGYGAHLARSMRNRDAPAPTAHATAPAATTAAPQPSAAATPTPPAAVPAALASAAAPPAPAAHLPEDEVASLRKKFKDAFRFRDWRGANRIALDLGKGAPEVYKDPEFVSYASSLAITLSKENAEGELMKLFSDELGPDGLDILYAFIEGQGKAPIAVAASKLLEDEARLARATPAMRIALELRNASCVDKLKLLERAGKEGDARARLVLETLGKSCFPNNADVDRVIFELRTRFPKR